MNDQFIETKHGKWVVLGLLAVGGVLAEAGGIPDLAVRTAPDGSRYAEGLLRGKDGVGIYTYAKLPKAGERRPVIVSRNPYVRNAVRPADCALTLPCSR